jgi:peptidylprolyl isomerase
MQRFLVTLVGLVVVLGGCGNSGETTSSAPASRESEAPDWKALETAAGKYSGQLVIPSGPPPTKKIVIKDLRVGDGRKLKPGLKFRAKYVALDYDSGAVRQISWKSPFFASFGLNQFVGAFEVGLGGIRVGGIRELISPSSLAYQDGALVYLIKVVKIGKDAWD